MNIIQLIAAQADKTPDNKALVYNQGFVTYRTLMSMVRRAAKFFSQYPAGTTVGLLMTDTPEQVAFRLGSMQVGVLTVPLSTRFPKQELDTRTRLFDIKILIVDADYSEKTQGYQTIHIDNIPHDELHEYRTSGDELAATTWSGGTTGQAAGLYWSHTTVISGTSGELSFWKKPEVAYVVAPLVSGLPIMILVSSLRVGGTMVIESRPFTPALIVENIAKHGVTYFLATSRIFAILLHRNLLTKDIVPERCITTGDPTSTKIYKEWTAKFGTRLINMFGATQIFGVATQSENDPLESIGRLWPNLEIKLLDDQGNEVPDGQPGQVWFSGPSRAVKDVSIDGSTNINGNWITTKDVFIREGEVYYHVGRTNDVFRVSNNFVNPFKVEESVRGIDGVVDAVVVPDFDQFDVCRVKVCVIADKQKDLDNLKHVILTQNYNLFSWERPKLVEFIDDVPRHPGSLKIQRSKLNPLFNYDK